MDRQIDKSTQRKARNKRIISISLWCAGGIALIVALTIYLGGGNIKESDLTTGTVTRGVLETSVAGSGRIVPAFEEMVNSPIASRIMAVYAKPGDSVRAGMPLLQLDLQSAETEYHNLHDQHVIKNNELTQLRLSNRTQLSDIEMKVKIKEMEVNRLAIEVENEQRLDSLGSGTGDRVRQAQTALATGRLELQGLRDRLVNERERLAALEEAAKLELAGSERNLQMMERTLSEGRIPAPLDGVLTYLNTKIGSTISVGERVAVVGDLSHFKVEGDIPEGSSYKVRPGADVIVRLGNVELEGSVVNIEPQSTSGAVPFTVSLSDASNPRLRPGVRVQVYISYGVKDDVLLIPNGSYYNGPGSYQLFVKDSNKLHRRIVTLGDCNRNFVEVTAGLETGETVVISDMSKFEKHSTLTIK